MRPTRQRCLGTLLTSDRSQSMVQGSRERVMVGMLQPLGLVLDTMAQWHQGVNILVSE